MGVFCVPKPKPGLGVGLCTSASNTCVLVGCAVGMYWCALLPWGSFLVAPMARVCVVDQFLLQ